MADTAGTAGTTLSSESPVTSDDIAAFASSEAGADSSPASPAPSETPAPATEGSEVSAATVPSESAGPIPFDRHKAVLENARREAREAAEREWRQRYGWAERMQPNEAENGARLYQWLNHNPQGFRDWLNAQIGEAPGQAPARPDEPPQPDLRAEDGTPVYSAPQLQKYMEWKERQFKSLVEPLQKKLQDREERERAQKTAWAAKTSASGLLNYARSNWPAFKELEGDVLALMKEQPKLSFHDAYIRAFSSSGQSKLKEQWQAEYQGTLARKQDASIAPPGKPAGTPKKYTEMDTMDLVKQEWDAMTRKR